ncbi:hypothetical protein NA78x_001440 [Anatilimnocola sp. NA78]|uniref:hypothetical protein n=1 Tax=Anatilimnocola sp. NA78 TaxID=3415683 RepID=UPI003CE4677E
MEESFDQAMNNGLDFTTNYIFNPAGNRLKRVVDQESGIDIDEGTTFQHGAAEFGCSQVAGRSTSGRSQTWGGL